MKTASQNMKIISCLNSWNVLWDTSKDMTRERVSAEIYAHLKMCKTANQSIVARVCVCVKFAYIVGGWYE
jgi:hypothetical protein